MDAYPYSQQLLNLPPPVVEWEHPLLACIHDLISLIPPRRIWSRTFYGLKLQVEKLQRHGQQHEALEVLLAGLQDNQFWVGHPKKWWKLTCLAVQLVQEFYRQANQPLQQPIQALLKLSSNAPQPWQGHDVAYCFTWFSIWSFELGKIPKAIELAKSAVFAAPHWGYAEYLLGWYGFIVEGIDSVQYFKRAILANPDLLSRLQADPLAQQYPEVLQQVSEQMTALYSASKIAVK